MNNWTNISTDSRTERI